MAHAVKVRFHFNNTRTLLTIKMGEPFRHGVPVEIVELLQSCGEITVQSFYETLRLLKLEGGDAERSVDDLWYIALESARDSADHYQLLSASLANLANLPPDTYYEGNPSPIYNLKTWSESVS